MDSKKDADQISMKMSSGAWWWNCGCLVSPHCVCHLFLYTKAVSICLIPPRPSYPRAVLAIYSLLFMRFAWMVTPRNYLLLGVHIVNETAQLNLIRKKLVHE